MPARANRREKKRGLIYFALDTHLRYTVSANCTPTREFSSNACRVAILPQRNAAPAAARRRIARKYRSPERRNGYLSFAGKIERRKKRDENDVIISFAVPSIAAPIILCRETCYVRAARAVTPIYLFSRIKDIIFQGPLLSPITEWRETATRHRDAGGWEERGAEAVAK